MAEKFQESELIFSDREYCRHPRREDGDDGGGEDYVNFNYRRAIVAAPRRKYRTRTASDGGRQTKKEMASSLPVRIPERIGRRMEEEDDEMDGDEMVPPHVVEERRGARKMAFSVCSGNGRTLKGSDLSRVRNSILRMTGFLET